MKKILALLLLAATTLTIAAAGKNKVDVSFDSTVYDFGTVSSASGPVTHRYIMTNDGNEPVVILSVSTTCGCTRPEYPKKPVAPGEKAEIKVNLLPEGQRGEISRNITLRLRSASGAKRNITLRITGDVIPAK